MAVVALTRWNIASVPQMPTTSSRFGIVLPPGQRMPAILLDRDLAISPDGRQVVYRVGGSTSGGGRLAIRGLDELEGHLLPGIDNARSPFFSADGRWVGFFARSESNGTIELRKISTAGGPSITVYQDGSLSSDSAAWSDDDSIIFPKGGSSLFRLSPAGGSPSRLPDSQEHAYGSVAFVSALPGKRGVLYTSRPTGTWFTGATEAQIAVLDFKTGTSRILARGSSPKYIPETRQTGYLVYASAGALLAARFDLDRLSMLGTPAPIVEHVSMSPAGAVDYDVSNTGTLVYVPATAASRALVWVDRQGHEEPTRLPAREYAFVRLSPDGTRVVLTGAEDHHLWIGDLSLGTVQQLTFGASEDGFPIWSADGQSVIFTSNRDGGWNLYSLPADASGDVVQLTNGGNGHFANSAAHDGRQILGANFSTSLDVVRFAVTGSAGTSVPATNSTATPFVIAEPLVKTPASEYDAILSPDEHFFAYQSNESGRSEVYVKPLPPTGGVRWQISASGGSSPLWAPNGRELYYRDSANAVIAVSYTTLGATFRRGTSTRLFDSYAAPSDMFNYSISPDGQHFLMLKDTSIGDENAVTAHFVVVLDWLQDLKAKVPTK
jgi:serine/threonine-protein kinase